GVIEQSRGAAEGGVHGPAFDGGIEDELLWIRRVRLDEMLRAGCAEVAARENAPRTGRGVAGGAERRTQDPVERGEVRGIPKLADDGVVSGTAHHPGGGSAGGVGPGPQRP